MRGYRIPAHVSPHGSIDCSSHTPRSRPPVYVPPCPLPTCCFIVACYCGDGTLIGVGTLTTCTMGCDNSPTYACGGPTSTGLSVYSIEVSPDTPQPPEFIVGDDGRAVRQGCYLFTDLNPNGGTAILAVANPAVTGLMTNKVGID